MFVHSSSTWCSSGEQSLFERLSNFVAEFLEGVVCLSASLLLHPTCYVDSSSLYRTRVFTMFLFLLCHFHLCISFLLADFGGWTGSHTQCPANGVSLRQCGGFKFHGWITGHLPTRLGNSSWESVRIVRNSSIYKNDFASCSSFLMSAGKWNCRQVAHWDSPGKWNCRQVATWDSVSLQIRINKEWWRYQLIKSHHFTSVQTRSDSSSARSLSVTTSFATRSHQKMLQLTDADLFKHELEGLKGCCDGRWLFCPAPTRMP